MGAGDLGPVRLNRNTMNLLLSGGLGIDAVLREDAQKVLDKARAIAPVDSGEYRDSLHIESFIRRERSGTTRKIYRVVASAPHSRLVEFQASTLAKAANAPMGRRGRRR
ncbi:MAG: HK97 gp10 family phage protein [Cellulomonadaceae bacterium]|jgi:hypothetical protein|nr:HK97 gp10 family phage protein [Cellulomonadaceae bacterium]